MINQNFFQYKYLQMKYELKEIEFLNLKLVENSKLWRCLRSLKLS